MKNDIQTTITEKIIASLESGTAPCNRFDAIQSVLERQQRRNCPVCGKAPSLAYIRASDGQEFVNSACVPCGYARDSRDRWKFYAGGMTRLG